MLESNEMTEATDPSRDFDFFEGAWLVSHRRLKARLVDCQDWEAFDGTCHMTLTMGGSGNFDDNVVNIPSGSYRAVTMRAFDPESCTWAIWWLDARTPHSLDVPVIGAFVDGVGTFIADDTLNGQAIRVRFTWSRTHTQTPRWEQAMSVDGGVTWETNWEMDFARP